jgi:hypothetical protein
MPNRPWSRTLALGLAAGATALAAAGALALFPRTAEAQTAAAPDPDPESLHRARVASERAHLRRVGAWGLANVVAGGTLALSSDRRRTPARHGFGVQSAGWGLVNTAIAAGGLAFGGRGEPPETPGDALAAESRWGQVLVLNLGLNVGYAMAGGALAWAGANGSSGGDALRGHGQAVVVQGAGLFVLDALAWAGHRERMRGFSRRLDGVTVGIGPGAGGDPGGGPGVRVSLPLR